MYSSNRIVQSLREAVTHARNRVSRDINASFNQTKVEFTQNRKTNDGAEITPTSKKET